MEHFFAYHSQPADFSWPQEEVLPQPSAFVSYTQQSLNEGPGFGSGGVNVKKRMREFLMRSMSSSDREMCDYSEKERCRRHMLSERMRREKQKNNYMRLHALLPSGTKRDKHSIILTAAQEVEELKKCREELRRQQNEMLGAIEGSRGEEESEMEQAKIRIDVARPSSGVDSMLEVLKCLKHTDSNVRLIQSKFLPQQFSAVLGIETKVGAAEVEQEVHRTLFQVEKKFRHSRVEPSHTHGSFLFHS
ncbi:hypothetical protein ACET3Z_029534 [Daucus carota]